MVAWEAVRFLLPVPRVRMKMAPLLLEAVTPLAEPDIRSNAIDGLYLIVVLVFEGETKSPQGETPRGLVVTRFGV